MHAASARAVVAESLSRGDSSGLDYSSIGSSGSSSRSSKGQSTKRLTDVLNDRAALTVLYYATSGANWQRNDQWLSEKPLGTWHGVSTDR